MSNSNMSEKEKFLVDVLGYNPIDAGLMLRSEVWPTGNSSKRIPRKVLVSINRDKAEFLVYRDPQIIFRVQTVLFEFGLYPPPWVSEFLASSFKKQLAGEGKECIRQLGLALGRGQNSFLEKNKLIRRNFLLVQDILLLSTIGNLSVERACFAVENEIERGGYLDRGIPYGLSFDRIQKIYYSSNWAIEAREEYIKTGKNLIVNTLKNSRDIKIILSNPPNYSEDSLTKIKHKIARDFSITLSELYVDSNHSHSCFSKNNTCE